MLEAEAEAHVRLDLMNYACLPLVLLLCGCRPQTQAKCLADRMTPGMSDSAIRVIQAACDDERRAKARDLTRAEIENVTGKAGLELDIPGSSHFVAHVHNSNARIELLLVVVSIDGVLYRVNTSISPLSAGRVEVFDAKAITTWTIVEARGLDVQ